MKTEELSTENAIATGIAELRERFPRTQDLYREVCILLFFRHGITPTANKLYQLVRKGSMSAPTEALSQFWKTLRERSRITIEHLDLPEELQSAAGEMVAAIWKSAQTMSRDALAEFRAESAEAVDAAKASEAQARAALATTHEEIEQIRAGARATEELTGQLRQELAAAAATKVGLEERLEDLRRQVADLQARLDRSHDERANEREKLAERTRLAEQRFVDMERRALQEIDRERTLSGKLQKTIESERTANASVNERLRTENSAAQQTIVKLRGQIISLEGISDALAQERNRQREELASTRSQLEAAIRQGAADNVRADQLRDEVERLRAQDTLTKPRTPSKRQSKRSGD